ncbi:hypothetical protein [Demequina mangrovi]|uniref:Uncharacterized protein n=1 Tax=Demequina mangrovi TaxID=1043493 RepID=A0A1H6W2W9_9MICO|nr:hypothetical protein [Demequina mangrovi]SEJ11331.1 hypothetical protein SAMN05421637_0820 [Demequina mangrovi]
MHPRAGTESRRRQAGLAAVILCAVLALGACTGGDSTSAASDEPARLTLAERTCATLAALGGDTDAAERTEQLLIAQGRSKRQAASLVQSCLVATAEATGEDIPTTTSPQDLGTLWERLDARVLSALAPIGMFVLIGTLAIVLLARLLALTFLMRDLPSRPGTRRASAIVGGALAVLAPLAIAMRALWIVRDDGPGGILIGESPWSFAWHALASPTGPWCLLLGAAGAGIVLLGYSFATRLAVTITVTGDTTGDHLDSVRIMTALDAMAGRTTSGLEYPVGTDVTSATAAIKDLSGNSAVAAAQALVAAIFGGAPWTVTVDNENASAASLTIARNGRVRAARRIVAGGAGPLAGATRAPVADRLAGLVAAHLLTTLRQRYRSELGRGLHGARDPDSIALHWVATSWYPVQPGGSHEGIGLLERATLLDPGNRAAKATLDNYEYRMGTVATRPHATYRDKVREALDEECDELSVGPVRAWLSWTVHLRFGRHRPSTPQLRRVLWTWAKRDALLLRLLQSYQAVMMNLIAEARVAGAAPDVLDELLQESERYSRALAILTRVAHRRDPTALTARRSMLNLVAALKRTPTDQRPKDLPRRERRAWDEATERAKDADGATRRMLAEEAVLAKRGRFQDDAAAAYSLACHRALQGWWAPAPAASLTEPPPRPTSVLELLTSAFRDPEIGAWAWSDPELEVVRRDHREWLEELAGPEPS